MAEDTYQHKLKCPECGKRKVYIRPKADGFEYYCTACGKEWIV